MKKLLSAILNEVPQSLRKALIPLSLLLTDILLILILRFGLLEAPIKAVKAIPWSFFLGTISLSISEKIELIRFFLINIDLVLFFVFLLNGLFFWFYFKGKKSAIQLIHFFHIPFKFLIVLLIIPWLDLNNVWFWMAVIIIFEIVFVIGLINNNSEDQPANKLK